MISIDLTVDNAQYYQGLIRGLPSALSVSLYLHALLNRSGISTSQRPIHRFMIGYKSCEIDNEFIRAGVNYTYQNTKKFKLSRGAMRMQHTPSPLFDEGRLSIEIKIIIDIDVSVQEMGVIQNNVNALPFLGGIVIASHCDFIETSDIQSYIRMCFVPENLTDRVRMIAKDYGGMDAVFHAACFHRFHWKFSEKAFKTRAARYRSTLKWSDFTTSFKNAYDKALIECKPPLPSDHPVQAWLDDFNHIQVVPVGYRILGEILDHRLGQRESKLGEFPHAYAENVFGVQCLVSGSSISQESIERFWWSIRQNSESVFYCVI